LAETPDDPEVAQAPIEEPAPLPARVGIGRRAWRGLAAHFAILATDRLTWFASLTAAIALTVSRYHASTAEYHARLTPAMRERGGLFAWAAAALHLDRLAGWLKHATMATGDYLYWFLGSLLLFGVIPIVAAACFPGVRIRELGVGLGDWRYGLKAFTLLYAVMLPFVVGASFMPAFVQQYPMSGGAAESWSALLVFEACYAAYFIGWEFIYRGMLCNGLYPRIGAAIILLHTIPFAVMHGGKPEPEAYGSIIAGIALGTVAVRARSFWYGALLHSAVAMTMDALALTQTHRWPKGW
jgi:membrane protease YdiL (CAAX protease family)